MFALIAASRAIGEAMDAAMKEEEPAPPLEPDPATRLTALVAALKSEPTWATLTALVAAGDAIGQAIRATIKDSEPAPQPEHSTPRVAPLSRRTAARRMRRNKRIQTLVPVFLVLS